MKAFAPFRMLTLLLVLLAGLVSTAQAAPLTEQEKIERLITYISKMEGAVFIRNGSEYSCKQAAEHLALKRKKAGSNIKTAEQFIKLLASKSSMTGNPYTVRFNDGRTVNSEQLLLQELARLNKIR